MAVDLQRLYPKLIHLMMDTVFVVDSDNQIVFVSDACQELLGYTASELMGTTITNYMHHEDLESSKASIIRVMSGQPHTDFRNRYIRKDGSVVFILWSARWYEEEGVRVGVARDVTAKVKAEEKLRFLAHHDPLTKLTNRSLFNDRLESALHTARRNNTGLALLFIDLNDFKVINDKYGHAIGDRVLCEVARRLEACTRATDTVARMGGDEFTVLLTELHLHDGMAPAAGTPDPVVRIIQHILTAMVKPLDGEFADFEMPSCSIGVARYPNDGQDAAALLSHADKKMYQAKKKRVAAEARGSKGTV